MSRSPTDRREETRSGVDATLTVGALAPAESASWDGYLDGHPRTSLYHSSRWLELVETVFGHDVHRLAARRADGSLAGALPLVRLASRLFGDFMVSLPFVNFGGALADEPAIEERLMDEAAALAGRLGCAHVEFRDDVEHARPCRTDKVLMERALPTDADSLMRSLGAKLRSQTRRPLREGATVHSGGAELLDDFYQVFAQNMRDLGTPVYSRTLFAAFLDAFPEATRIVSVRVRGAPAAAGFLVRHRERCEIPWASSLREHNRIGVNMLLYAEALKWAIESGATLFDFGRSTRDGGTYRFKLQWGAEPRQLYWHYWLADGGELPALTPSNPKYRLAIALWQRLPVSVTRLVGPRLVKYLP